MRIISGFKDYYDYIANQNVDNKIIYNRQCQAYDTVDKNGRQTYQLSGPHDPNVAHELTFPGKYYDTDRVHFCGIQHPFVAKDGRFVYDPTEIYSLLAAEMRRKRERSFAFSNLRWTFERHHRPLPSSLNTELNAPVVLQYWFNDRLIYLTNISLKAIDFVQLFAPEQAFMMIYNFLAPKEIEPDRDPDNLARYEAKGFDKKVSFRKRK